MQETSLHQEELGTRHKKRQRRQDRNQSQQVIPAFKDKEQEVKLFESNYKFIYRFNQHADGN